MNNFLPPILKLLKHYAAAANDAEVAAPLNRVEVESVLEARALYAFLSKMCELVAADAKKGVVVLSQPVHTADAEKVCEAVEDYLNDLGYEDVTSA